ncbi:MAG: conserved membrane protein of unknown function [Promethearchaeota archaeon]|nr:MAG: conserved membrane protein of unknown function [Candidatus Lokiarchaeota archaeon]
MGLKDLLYKIKLRMSFQVIKHSLLDMKRDKSKMIFGVLGIAISIFLLTAIGMLNNTMSYNYVKVTTNTTGEADIIITRTIQTDLTFNPFFDQDIINDLDDIEEVREFFPRIMMLVETSSDKTTDNGSLQTYGIDFQKEAEDGNMGNLMLVDDDGNETEEIYEGTPDDDECIILENVAELLNVSRGDTIHLDYQQYTMDVEVAEICVQDRKFSEYENALIILNLDVAQEFLRREGEINYIYGTLKDPETIYDASNLDGTTKELRRIGTKIQQRLDLNKYSVSMPKLEELQQGEFLLLGTTTIFWFITFLAMLITGILINSILSTSSEEKIREFGILRVVGGGKIFPIKVVLFEGFLLGVIGSVIGIILGLFFTEPIAQIVLQTQDFEFLGENIQFVILPQTLIIAGTIGSLVPLVVSLFPALKTAQVDLIKSITPFQQEGEGWEIKKEGSMNVKLVLIGISISTIGVIIFVLMPQVFVSGDFMLIAGLFIGLLAAILIGMVFASIGIIPFIQTAFLKIISFTIRKYNQIVKISLKRYRRRNTSTVIMFAISFSFIFFVTTYTEMSSDNMALNLRFQYGSDLVLINEGQFEDNNAMDMAMIDELKEMKSIDSVGISLHNTFDIQAALARLFEFSEGGVGFSDDSDGFMFAGLFGGEEESEQKYQTRIGDIANHDSLDAGFIGVNEEFVQLINRDHLIWSSRGSSYNYSFTSIFENNNTCIIAKSIADVLGIENVGEKIRLTFYNPKVENDPGNITVFTVAGISGGIPGFWNFRSSQSSANGGGVMVSLDTYMNLMDVKNPGEGDMVVDKAFVNLKDDSEESIKNTKNEIATEYRELEILVDDAITKIKYMEDMNERQSVIMEIILMFTVLICIFGLISSMYATMLERKFEIGIIRSLGLKTRNVRNMFLVESMIVMLSAGILGTIIGTYSAYLLQTNMSLMTELPVVFSIPMDTLLRVFIISVAVGIVGMYIILIRLSRQSIMDIFRQTF